jgi:hypothetical protein
VVAFISSILILVGIVAIGMAVGRRRPVGKHLTWGEALVAATFVFLGFFYAYGLVPHLWLTWADSELKWRPDVLLSDYPFWGVKLGFLNPVEKGGWIPMTITMQTLRDIIAVLIYVVLLGFNMWLWAWWQKRGTKEAVSTDVVTSDFGRPLVKKA